MDPDRYLPPKSIWTREHTKYPTLRIRCLGPRLQQIRDVSRRVWFRGDTITLRGWPSRGGFIDLDHAAAPDFEYLRLDLLDPPLRRDPDPNAEDAFCRALLRLGATWWDSERRRRFIADLSNGSESAHEAVEADESLLPTQLERTWTRVAWPSQPAGSLCVLAREVIIMGRTGGETLRPAGHGLIALARTMDERYDLLKRFGGTVYKSLEEYSKLSAKNRQDPAEDVGHQEFVGGILEARRSRERSPPTYLTAWEEGFREELTKLTKAQSDECAAAIAQLDKRLWDMGTAEGARTGEDPP